MRSALAVPSISFDLPAIAGEANRSAANRSAATTTANLTLTTADRAARPRRTPARRPARVSLLTLLHLLTHSPRRDRTASKSRGEGLGIVRVPFATDRGQPSRGPLRDAGIGQVLSRTWRPRSISRPTKCAPVYRAS